MAVARKVVINDCLVINKFRKLGSNSLKVLLCDFYKLDELGAARELLLDEVAALKLPVFPKVARRRRDSSGRGTPDVDDMCSVLFSLDERQLLDQLSIFASSNPDNMPSVRLVEGDLSVLWSKLDKILDIASSTKAAIEVSTSTSSIQSDTLNSIKTAILDTRSSIGNFPTSAIALERTGNVWATSDPQPNNSGPPRDIAAGSGASATARHSVGPPASAEAEQVEGNTARTWGSITSESELDNGLDNGGFTSVVSKKKRKNRSPGELGEGAAVRSDTDGRKLRKLNEGGDNSSRPAANKWPSSRSANPPALSSGGRSAAAASAGAVSQQRITGKSTQQTTLKASAILSAPVEKATFFISNVEMKCGEKDIRRHLCKP